MDKIQLERRACTKVLGAPGRSAGCEKPREELLVQIEYSKRGRLLVSMGP